MAVKKVVKKKAEVNIPEVKSIIGERTFNREVTSEILSGATVQEAPELVARRLARLK